MFQPILHILRFSFLLPPSLHHKKAVSILIRKEEQKEKLCLFNYVTTMGGRELVVMGETQNLPEVDPLSRG